MEIRRILLVWYTQWLGLPHILANQGWREFYPEAYYMLKVETAF